MTGGREAARRPARAPLRRRSRQLWAVAGGVAACWLVLAIVMGSAVSAAIVLLVLAALVAAGLGGLRALGITGDHPWIRRMTSRPWLDGDSVSFDAQPGHYDAQPGRYDAQPGRYDAQPGRYDAQPGRYDAQPGHYAGASPEWAYSGPPHAYAEPGGYAWGMPDPDLTVGGGMVTMMEPTPTRVPVLRLVTGSSVAETRISGARAGRGPVELVLPDVLTVSREHATFTFSEGRWWITNQGRNGLILNGAPIAGEQPLSDGDKIRWGASPDAPLSRVKIG
jgi:FHA domain